MRRANFNTAEVAHYFYHAIPEERGAFISSFFTPSGRTAWVVFWLN